MNAFWKLLLSTRGELWAATAAHLELVLEALVLALAIGVPLGVVASRSRRWERVVLTLANVLQTIPSLALLGFLLIAFHGAIGKPPALAALVVYALLPIIKNTVVGLRGVEPGVIEAATGMGMTGRQRLFLVELPLAVPVILGGVRLAVVASIGMATIAALIGARSLGHVHLPGRLVERHEPDPPRRDPDGPARPGLRRGPGRGRAPARPATDGASGLAGRPRAGDDRGVGRGRRLGGLGGVPAAVRGPRPSGSVRRIRPSRSCSATCSPTWSRPHTDLRADRRLNLGGTLVCYNAVARGGLDAYVEYTGTALTAILKQPPRNDPDAVLAKVRALCQERDGVRRARPARVREHVRRPDAPRAGRAARNPHDLRPPRPPGHPPRRLRPRVHEPSRRLPRPGAGLRPALRPRPPRDGPQPPLRGRRPRHPRRRRRATRPTAGSTPSTSSSWRTTAAISRPTRPCRSSARRPRSATPPSPTSSTASPARSTPRRCGG